mmetsp:Transcript_10403/g.29724  ORF Transcript_10403/g.29724 Transcript_10403/m.29724 type:complete len:291 (+) Transcript_10403:2604-3476(+)
MPLDQLDRQAARRQGAHVDVSNQLFVGRAFRKPRPLQGRGLPHGRRRHFVIKRLLVLRALRGGFQRRGGSLWGFHGVFVVLTVFLGLIWTELHVEGRQWLGGWWGWPLTRRQTWRRSPARRCTGRWPATHWCSIRRLGWIRSLGAWRAHRRRWLAWRGSWRRAKRGWGPRGLSRRRRPPASLPRRSLDIRSLIGEGFVGRGRLSCRLGLPAAGEESLGGCRLVSPLGRRRPRPWWRTLRRCPPARLGRWRSFPAGWWLLLGLQGRPGSAARWSGFGWRGWLNCSPATLYG